MRPDQPSDAPHASNTAEPGSYEYEKAQGFPGCDIGYQHRLSLPPGAGHTYRVEENGGFTSLAYPCSSHGQRARRQYPASEFCQPRVQEPVPETVAPDEWQYKLELEKAGPDKSGRTAL